MAKKYEELTFTDDFMFCKILEQHPEFCKELLELILGHGVGNLVSVNRQKPVDITADGHGVRFDIYAEGNDTTVYDVEMQNVNTGSIPKRSRYAQGMIDLNLIEQGTSYSELNRSYLIYICKFNLFAEAGLHKYTFLNLCRENPQIELGDETQKIYLCATGTADDITERMKSFLQFLITGTPDDSFTDNLHSAVEDAKFHKRWRQEYMTLLENFKKEREEGRAEGFEEGREEGRAEGREEGREEGIFETLASLVQKKLLALKDAAEQAGISEEEFLKKTDLK